MTHPATADLTHVHRFVPGDAGHPPLLLLHGTGGNEEDLLPLGEAIGPGRALLSPRGQVLEHGMPRFFRRLSEGVFDEADLVTRAGALAAFIAEARSAYGLSAPVAVGFSNGANIAAALLLLPPGALSGAILLRAMTPLQVPPVPETIVETPVLVLSGAMDPIVPASNAERLVAALTAAGGQVTQKVLPVGHQLSQADLTFSKEWLAARG